MPLDGEHPRLTFRTLYRLDRETLRREPDRVAAVGARAGPVVVHRTRPLGGQILIERAAQRHIDELDAAADAEDRKLPLAGGGEERELEEVPLAVRRIEQGRAV